MATPDPRVTAWLWHRAAEHRNAGHRFDTVRLLEDARDEGVVVGWRELVWLLDRDVQLQPWTPSQFLLDFIRRYLVDRRTDVVVDPCVTTPTLLPALLDGDIAQRGVGFVREAPLRELAALTAGGERIGWHDAWSIPLLDGEQPSSLGAPDLIVSMPPIGFQDGKRAVRGVVTAVDGSSVEVQGDTSSLSVLTGLELAPGGEALFLLPAAFLFRRRPLLVRERLADLGLHVHAAIDVRQATRATGINFVLLVVRREPIENTFVGQLTPKVDGRQLVKSMRRRRRGAVPALGRLIPWDTFNSFDDVVARERVERLVTRAKTSMRPLADVLAEDIVATPRDSEARLSPSPNTVYLPTFLSATVQADAQQTSGKASGYYRLVLDPSRALADYVAAMLNTELGRALRTTWAGGTTIPSIRLSSLRSAELPLPDMKIQRTSSETLARIAHVRGRLEALEHELAEAPGDAERIGRRLSVVGQFDPLVSWIEGLPFPLASILWRYRADADPSAKVDHLLRFFEATAEFFVAVLLSAFASDADLFEAERGAWLGNEKEGLRRASFGSWTNLGAGLAKGGRRLLGKSQDDPDRVRMRDAFGLGSDVFVAAVTAAALWKLLDEVRPERNADAHGGIRSQKERAAKLLRLEDKLDELREHLSEAMNDVQLVKPGAGSRSRGLSRYSAASVLTGPNQSFRQEPLVSLPALDDELYLVDVTQEPLERALQLVPLVRFRSAPQAEENACYFYSRIDGGKVQFVSHHFEREARIAEDDPDLVALLDSLVQAP
jgi:hypothetical protein